MRIPVLPGDGIGPEIAAVTVQALERLDRRFALDLAFDFHEVGLASLTRSGTTLPEPVVSAPGARAHPPCRISTTRRARKAASILR
jgi:3-isopropylmalate dehydrogenase